MSAVRGPYKPHLHACGGSPVQVVVQLRGEVVVHEEQVAHLLGVGLPSRAASSPRRVVFGASESSTTATSSKERLLILP